MSEATVRAIARIVANEQRMIAYYRPQVDRVAPVEPTRGLFFSEAGLAVLAAKTRYGRMTRAAQSRRKYLMEGPIRAILGGRTVGEVAQEAGIPRPTVQKVLSGRRQAKMDTLVPLARALRVPTAVLIEHLTDMRLKRNQAQDGGHSTQSSQPEAG